MKDCNSVKVSATVPSSVPSNVIVKELRGETVCVDARSNRERGNMVAGDRPKSTTTASEARWRFLSPALSIYR